VTFRLHALRKVHDDLRELQVRHHQEHMQAITRIAPQENDTPAAANGMIELEGE